MKLVLGKDDLTKVVEDWAKKVGYEVSAVHFDGEPQCEVDVSNINPIKKTPKKSVAPLEED